MPTKYNKPQVIKAIIHSLEHGSSMGKACESAGITRETLWAWRKKSDSLNEKILQTLEYRIETVEDALFSNATSGNITAQIFWLCNRARDRWQNVNKVEHTGENTENITEKLKGILKEFIEPEEGKK